MSTQKPLLQANKITKDFGEGRGVFDVSFKILPGEIVGFVGPNGAGKTTTMSILSGFIGADSGEFSVFGKQNLGINSMYSVMQDMGILLADVAFPRQMTARQIFKLNSALLPTNSKIDWGKMSKQLDLDLDTKFGKLSTGNKKKVGVISAVMHKPKLIIMDEPTAGLDPLIQQKFLNILEKIADDGGAILLSSHVLSEVQAACDRVIMIKAGRILFDDDTKSILNKALKRFRFTDLDNSTLKEIQKLPDTTVDVQKNEIIVLTPEREGVLKILSKHQVYEFFLEKPSLEEMFIEYYG